MEKEYLPAKGATFGKETAQVLGEALEEINRRNGSITPEAVIEYASDLNSPIHNLFDWDSDVAARKWRLHQARHLISSLNIRVVAGGENAVVRYAYNINDGDGDRRYVRIEDMNDPEMINTVVNSTLEAMESLKDRLSSFNKATSIIRAITKAQERIKKTAEKVTV